MERRYRGDLIAWSCTVPSSVLFIACLFLPQSQTCQHHVHTPADNGSGVVLVIMAVLALAPLVWRLVPRLRPGVTGAAIGTALVVALGTRIGILIAIVFAVVRPWRSREELVCCCLLPLAMLFALVFPLVALFGELEIGGELTELAAVLTCAGIMAWWSAARGRTYDRERWAGRVAR